jgi:hypothetical protein
MYRHHVLMSRLVRSIRPYTLQTLANPFRIQLLFEGDTEWQTIFVDSSNHTTYVVSVSFNGLYVACPSVQLGGRCILRLYNVATKQVDWCTAPIPTESLYTQFAGDASIILVLTADDEMMLRSHVCDKFDAADAKPLIGGPPVFYMFSTHDMRCIFEHSYEEYVFVDFALPNYADMTSHRLEHHFQPVNMGMPVPYWTNRDSVIMSVRDSESTALEPPRYMVVEYSPGSMQPRRTLVSASQEFMIVASCGGKRVAVEMRLSVQLCHLVILEVCSSSSSETGLPVEGLPDVSVFVPYWKPSQPFKNVLVWFSPDSRFIVALDDAGRLCVLDADHHEVFVVPVDVELDPLFLNAFCAFHHAYSQIMSIWSSDSRSFSVVAGAARSPSIGVGPAGIYRSSLVLDDASGKLVRVDVSHVPGTDRDTRFVCHPLPAPPPASFVSTMPL